MTVSKYEPLTARFTFQMSVTFAAKQILLCNYKSGTGKNIICTLSPNNLRVRLCEPDGPYGFPQTDVVHE